MNVELVLDDELFSEIKTMFSFNKIMGNGMDNCCIADGIVCAVSGERHDSRSYERRPRSRERSYAQPAERPMPVGDRIDRDRSERTQRQVEKLEQMEVAIDRKLEQIQRYERKYEETMRDEKYG